MAALLALVCVPPEFRGPADLYRVHGTELVYGELMGFSVRGAVRAEDVGHLRLWPHLRLFVERADDGAEILPAHVQIEGRGLQGPVAQKELDVTEIRPALEEGGGEGMSQ